MIFHLCEDVLQPVHYTAVVWQLEWSETANVTF